MIVMKKALVLVFLIVMLVTCLMATPICYAATISSNNSFYEVTNKDGLQTYILPQDSTTYVQSIIIPYSYFFKVNSSAAEGYYNISYNNCNDLYVSEATLMQNVRATTYQTDESFTVGPYYTLTLTAPATALQLYKKDFSADTALVCDSIKFVGYTTNDNEYYFLVNATFTILGTQNNELAYVKATDVISTSFDPKNIAINPDSKQAKDEKEAKDVEVAQNMLKRNIFIIVICVACVLVVVLIYNPFKKKTNSRPVNDITANEDF